MKTAQDIRTELDAVEAELRASADPGTEVTPEEFDAKAELRSALTAEYEKAVAREKVLDEVRSQASKPNATAPGFHAPNVIKQVDPFDENVYALRGVELRDRALRILDDKTSAGHLRAESLEKAERLTRELGDRHARHAIATMRPEYRDAFGKYITNREAQITPDEWRAVEEVRAAALTDASGGYAVPELLDPSVILTNDGTANPIRQVARTVTGVDNVWRGVTSAGVTASWDAEAAEVSDDAATLGSPTITAYKGQAFIPFSVEIQGDWSGLASAAVSMFQDAKDRLEGTAFATGGGSTAPYGILTALDANTNVEVTPTTDGAFGAVDLFKAMNNLPPRWRPNAQWMMSLDAMNEVRSFSSSSNGTYYTVDLTQGYGFRILGRPAHENSGFPDFTGTTGASNILVVGDWSQYVIFDRVGASVELIPHLFSTGNGRPTGQRGWIFWWRVGADSIVDTAFRLLQNQ